MYYIINIQNRSAELAYIRSSWIFWTRADSALRDFILLTVITRNRNRSRGAQLRSGRIRCASTQLARGPAAGALPRVLGDLWTGRWSYLVGLVRANAQVDLVAGFAGSMDRVAPAAGRHAEFARASGSIARLAAARRLGAARRIPRLKPEIDRNQYLP